MIIISVCLSDYCKNIIKNGRMENILDNNNHCQDLCYIVDNCRPIFTNSNSYTDMDKLLTFLNRNSVNLIIFDKTNNRQMIQKDFFNFIVNTTLAAKYDFQDILNMTDNKFINTIKDKLYQDESMTIWYDRINKFK